MQGGVERLVTHCWFCWRSGRMGASLSNLGFWKSGFPEKPLNFPDDLGSSLFAYWGGFGTSFSVLFIPGGLIEEKWLLKALGSTLKGIVEQMARVATEPPTFILICSSYDMKSSWWKNNCEVWYWFGWLQVLPEWMAMRRSPLAGLYARIEDPCLPG